MSKGLLTKALVAGTAMIWAAGASATTLYGPTPYTGVDDSPFTGVSFSQFYLEDFQDGLLNIPGVSGNGGIFVGAPGSLSDSVEFTPNGASYFTGNGLSGIEFIFDAAVLGALPTYAGLVWTDGSGLITFEAFDQNGFSLGTVSGTHADADQTGQTGEDRFYGVKHESGISRILVRNGDSGIEVDHLQYGIATVTAVPEPAAWAMMIAGFGVIGAGLRRCHRRIGTAPA